jgi:hypothetical protein
MGAECCAALLAHDYDGATVPRDVRSTGCTSGALRHRGQAGLPNFWNENVALRATGIPRLRWLSEKGRYSGGITL